LSTSQEMLDLYISAEKAVLKGKTVTFGERSLGRENLSEIIKGRQEWQARVNSEKARTQGGNSLYSTADFT